MKSVVIDAFACSQMEHLFNFFKEPFAMFVLADIPKECGGDLPMNVSEMTINPHLGQFHIVDRRPHECSDDQRKCDMLENLPYCASLTHLSFTNVRINRGVGQRLARAVQTGNLPQLESLSFKSCSFEEGPLLIHLFQPVWSKLTHLDLREIDLDQESQNKFDQ